MVQGTIKDGGDQTGVSLWKASSFPTTLGSRGTPSLSDQSLLMSSIIARETHSRPQDTGYSWAQPSSSRRQESVSWERGGWIELIGKRVNSNCLMENVYSAISSCAINKSLTVLMILVETQETARPDYTRPGSLLELLHVLNEVSGPGDKLSREPCVIGGKKDAGPQIHSILKPGPHSVWTYPRPTPSQNMSASPWPCTVSRLHWRFSGCATFPNTAGGPDACSKWIWFLSTRAPAVCSQNPEATN